jgi:hypothetical protein
MITNTFIDTGLIKLDQGQFMVKNENIFAKNLFTSMMSKTFLLAAGFFPFVSNADMVHPNPPALTVQASLATVNIVTYEGQPDSVIQLIKSAGSNVPFASGIKQIVPDGWHAYKQKGLVVPNVISWTGGATWTDTLKTIGSSSKVGFVIKWNEKVVQVVAPRQETRDFLPQSVVPPVQQVVKVEARPVMTMSASITQFIVNPGTVRDAFNEIAVHYGYSLHWVVNESAGVYKFSYPVVLQGKDIKEDLNTLNNALGSGKQSLFALDMYEGNKVIRVKSQGD